MNKKIFSYLFIFCLSIKIFSTSSIKESFLLNIDFNYKVLYPPIVNKQYIIVPIQKEKNIHGILIYDNKLKKQHFVYLSKDEFLIDNPHIVANQIIFTTTKNKKQNILFIDLNTLKLSRINKTFDALKLQYYTDKRVLFTEKNKDFSSLFIINLKTKKNYQFPKNYKDISNVIQIDQNQNQALAIVSVQEGQQKIIFIDTKKKIIRENRNHYQSISKIDLLSNKKAITKLAIAHNKQKIGLIDFEKQSIIESPNHYYGIEYEIFPNKNVLAIGATSFLDTRIIFVDPYSNQIQEWPKKYSSLWGLDFISDNKMVGFIEDNLRIISCIQINLGSKDIQETPILDNIYFPQTINKEKIIAYHIDKKSAQYALGFLDPSTGNFDRKTNFFSLNFFDTDTDKYNEKIENSNLSNKMDMSQIANTIINVDNLGQGILTQEGKHNLFILNIKRDLIQSVDKKYSNIEFSSFSHVDKLFGLATKESNIIPVFIDFKTNSIQEFNQSYQKIITNLRSNTNGTVLASVLAHPNQEIVICFNQNTEKITEFFVKEGFPQSFYLKNLYSFRSCKPIKDYHKPIHNNDVVLVNDKNECIIRQSFYIDHTYFIPYKKQLLICPEHIENLSINLN